MIIYIIFLLSDYAMNNELLEFITKNIKYHNRIIISIYFLVSTLE